MAVAGRCAAVVSSHQCDLPVRLVRERLVVTVEALLPDLAIGLEGAHPLPVLAQAVIIHLIQMLPRFALPAQAVIQTNEDR
jgi:hypothetical protein